MTCSYVIRAAASGPIGSLCGASAAGAPIPFAVLAICRPATKPSRYRFCSGSNPLDVVSPDGLSVVPASVVMRSAPAQSLHASVGAMTLPDGNHLIQKDVFEL